MMLARVADSLYWIGRYIERAEHLSRLSDVMLTASVDQTVSAAQAAHIALAAVGETEDSMDGRTALEAARHLVFDRDDHGSVCTSLARARENARQVRDQITTETWERLNLLYLRATSENAELSFTQQSNTFLHEIIADLHQFKGAADATMSHGEGWRFLLLGVHLERAQLIARLLEVCFGDAAKGRPVQDHFALVSVLRMGCALEPYLRVYTADVQPDYVLEFMLLDAEYPRSIRHSVARIEEHLQAVSRYAELPGQSPERLAGRMNARLEFADFSEVTQGGASAFLATVVEECARIHESVYETFVAYPLERRLPA
jgi:uncharacterized alpha-E superfamily protein